MNNTAPRLPWHQLAPQAYKAMVGVKGALAGSGLGTKLIAELSLVVAMMNAWNRIGVGMRNQVPRKPLQAA